MGSVVLDDRTGRMEVAVFADLYEECRELLSADKMLVVHGNLVYDDYRGSLSLRAEKVYEFEQAREAYAEGLHLRLDPARISGNADRNALVAQLHSALAPFRGGRCGVLVEYRRCDAVASLRLGSEWRVRPADALLKRLRDLLGTTAVRVVFRRGGVATGAERAAFG
jgi:DNA polymerase-3 subunit alpha